MSPESAKNLMEGLAWLSMPINKIANDISLCVDDKNEKEELAKPLKALFHAFFDLQDHIIDQYPDLDPSGKWEDEFFKAKVKYQAVGHPPRRLTEEEIKSAEEAGARIGDEIRKNMVDKTSD